MGLRRAGDVQLERGGWGFFRFARVTTSGIAVTFRGRGLERLEGEHAAGAALIGTAHGRRLWWAGEHFWWEDDGLSAEEVALTLWDRERRRQGRLTRLRRLRAREEDASISRRARIPDDVRVFVWTRDDGRCVRCGAEDDLQFDHVIPIARGGGNAADNIQILCGDCNRLKGDAIA